MITDDPDTPGPGYWEINLSAFLLTHARSRALEMPRIDANYGVGRHVQLKFEAPWLRTSEGGEVRTGAGNAVAGVKYRFLGQEGQTVAWSIYPQLEFNVAHASVNKGLVDEGPRFLIPTELTIEIDHVEINGEVGRTFVRNGDNTFVYGISTEAHIVPRVELLAELHWESRPGTRDEMIVNVGARPKLTKQAVLLLAVGRGVRGADDTRPRLLVYTGVQFNLPGLYSFKELRPAPR